MTAIENMTALQWMNAALFVLVVLAAFGSLNKMHISTTRPCIIAAVFLIAMGAVAQGLSYVYWEELDGIAETLTYGGTFALLIASQKTHTWGLERWANPVASIAAVVVFAVAATWLLFGGRAHAQEAPAKAVPQCADVSVMVLDNAKSMRLYVFDDANYKRLQTRQLQLQRGECRLGA